VAIDYGTADERWLGDVTVGELRRHLADGQFAAGSMGPKVDAACRFVERTGGLAVIASLDAAVAAIDGAAGTRVRAASA
jgi:carbamate kinase